MTAKARSKTELPPSKVNKAQVHLVFLKRGGITLLCYSQIIIIITINARTEVVEN